MVNFIDLPIELLPIFLRHIVNPQHLTSCCLVNKIFYSFAIPLLYERIHIYPWHKHGKVTSLFKILSERPDIAQHVRVLELRAFPQIKYQTNSYNSLIDSCLKGLANCTALRSCTWTRDKTLSTEILDVLSSNCPALKELEINGHAVGAYDPQCLLRFVSLFKISLIMPSAEVISILPGWLQTTGLTLTAFHVLCKASNLITDATLERLAPSMIHLEHFHIVGCPKVTHKGLMAVLSQIAPHLKSLRLEGLSSVIDLSALAESVSPYTSLTSLTLAPVPILSSAWCSSFLRFTAHCPLSELYLYLAADAGTTLEPHYLQLEGFLNSILEVHALRLRKFAIHKLRLPLEMIGNICASCPNLESLFIDTDSLVQEQIVSALSKSKSLRNIHVNFPPAEQTARMHRSEVLRIASKLGSQVQQIGFMNFVYQLDRIARLSQTNEVTTDIVLVRDVRAEVPEQFLAIQT